VIPAAYIQAWAATTPWPDQRQVEQDLIISRALCDILDEPYLAERLAFRGGTAIHKLLFRQPLRYSEDIDFVQVRAEPIGHTVDAVRRALSWLGPCRRKSAAHSIHLVFSFAPEASPTTNAKLKIEINTREHENLYGIRTYPFAVENPWFSGKVTIASFEPEELFGTKLRALLQRRKGRDLFDLHEGLKQLSLDTAKVIAAFHHYLEREGTQISRANAEERMLEKLTRSLTDDIRPMLAANAVYGDNDALEAFERVWFSLIVGLNGEAWHKSEAVIDEFRATSLPKLLRSGPRS
jgi:predicted nucleotidyltransferase component of viral defense system